MGTRELWGVLILGLVLFVGVATLVRAGEEPAPRDGAVIVVTKSAGERTIRIVQDADGRWVATEEEAGDEDAEPAPRMRVLRLAATSEDQPPAHGPLHTVARWWMEKHTGHEISGDPLTAWFEGEDVPLGDLRDALVADGWDAPRIQAWFARPDDVGARRSASVESLLDTTNEGIASVLQALYGKTPDVPAVLLWHDGTTWRHEEMPSLGGRHRGPHDADDPHACGCPDCPRRSARGAREGEPEARVFAEILRQFLGTLEGLDRADRGGRDDADVDAPEVEAAARRLLERLLPTVVIEEESPEPNDANRCATCPKRDTCPDCAPAPKPDEPQRAPGGP